MTNSTTAAMQAYAKASQAYDKHMAELLQIENNLNEMYSKTSGLNQARTQARDALLTLASKEGTANE